MPSATEMLMPEARAEKAEPALPSVLVVDDDPQILTSIARVLEGRFDVIAETSPTNALALLASGREMAVILTDLRMPEMSGLTLLQRARSAAPHTQRVLMSGAAQLSDTVVAVNDCQVFRVLIKPYHPRALVEAVSEACEQYNLLTAERVLLEETLQGSVQALAELFLMVQPAAFGRAMRLRRHVGDLAGHVGVTRKWHIEMAALFSQVGSVSLTEETLDRWYRGRTLSGEEATEVARLAATAQGLIGNIPRLEPVLEILRLQDAPASQTGLPEGARMLRIAKDFDLLISQGQNAEQALGVMEGRDGQYDRDYLVAFRALRGKAAPAKKIEEVRLLDVVKSMILASDVYAQSGLLLIARGQHVTPGLLHRIRTQWRDFAADTVVRVVIA